MTSGVVETRIVVARDEDDVPYVKVVTTMPSSLTGFREARSLAATRRP